MRQQVLDLVGRHLGRGHYSGEENVSLRCPFHKGGEETRPSFSVNVTSGVWQCFTCKASGTLPKLLKMLGLPRHVIDAELADIREELEDNKRRLALKKRLEVVSRDPFLAAHILPEALLRPYEFCPMPLVNAGFKPEWLQYMDVGFDRVNQRITYPIRDIYGNLAGMSGGATIAGQYPKYKVYQGRRKDPETGRWIGSDYGDWFDETYPNYQFQNHHFLWNYDQVYPSLFFGKDDQYLIIVEGFKACLWLLQCGYKNTVALMGSSLSDRQASLINRVRTNVILFLDNDEAGRKGTNKIAKKLRQTQKGTFVANYPYADCQPDDLKPDEITASITNSLSYPQWIKERYAS